VHFLIGTPPGEGLVLILVEPISFWGGVCSETGAVIDTFHPQFGASLAGRIVYMPVSKGSTAGPGALLELIYAGLAPAAIITPEPDLAVLTAACMAQALGVPVPAIGTGRPVTVEAGSERPTSIS
tara:strand:+ start:18794 stop:19168 length:375 start_codon:yes stop_codon:yes gene_type:complete